MASLHPTARAPSRRGFTLVEVMVVSLILATLLTASFAMSDMANRRFRDGSVKHQTQIMAQKVMDEVVEDLRQSAAWTYFRVSNTSAAPGSGAGDSIQRLTRFVGASGLTRGPGGGSFTFGPFDARTDAVAFLRLRNANVVSGNTAGGYAAIPAYLLLDFEPLNPTALTADRVGSGALAGNGAPADNQPGRMDDDPDRRFVLFRTVEKAKRLFVQRVRGVAAITNDGAANGTGAGPASGLVTSVQEVVDVGELGPAAGDVPPGKLEIEAIDTGNPTGAGTLRVHVRANGLVKRTATGSPEVVTTDLETYVTAPCAVPPL